GSEKESTMQNFTSGVADLTVDKDGNQLVTMKFTSGSMIKDFKVNGKEAVVIDEDTNEDTKIFEFLVENITEKLDGEVSVVVPGMYDTTYDVELVFDKDSLEKVIEDPEEEPEE